VLLRAPYRLSLAYADKDGVWTGSWHDAATLPSAVRLSIRDAATDRVLPISTVAVVHTNLPADCATSVDDCDEPGKKKKNDPQSQSGGGE
jgi:general secretion pathway protein J